MLVVVVVGLLLLLLLLYLLMLLLRWRVMANSCNYYSLDPNKIRMLLLTLLLAPLS